MNILLVFLSFLGSASAQDFSQEPRFYMHAQAPKLRSEFTDQFAKHPLENFSSLAADPYLVKMSNQLAKEIDQKYSDLLSGLNTPYLCDNSSYVRALKISGEFQACVDFAQSCLESKASPSTSVILADGAACANKIALLDTARTFYNRVTSDEYESEDSFQANVLKYALFTLASDDDSQFQNILRKSWSGEELIFISALLKYLNRGALEGNYTEEQAFEKTLELINSGEPEMANLMTQGWMTNLLWNHYDAIGLIKFAEKYFHHINDPDAVMRLVDLSFYRQDRNNFKLGKVILDTYYKYANSYSPFPVENNIFTVTEQYNKQCKTTLSQGNDYKTLMQLKNKFKSGSELTDLIAATEQLNKKSSDKADIHTFLGFLYETKGEEVKAEDLFWSAHKLCPYYHRSHWALAGIHKDQRYRAFKDYQQIRDHVDQELTTVEFSPSLSTYVMNWKSLNEKQADGVKYAIKIFAPYMDGLVKADTRLYVKVSFEFESEIPGYESDRDQRAPAPDNRLADELRGRGGNPVITDIGETMRTPHGDYNLAAHEMAHSWHLDYLSSVGGVALQACINQLYEAAKARGVFAEPYSATHDTEYFAQAIGYYLTKSDAPTRYGLTVDWLKKNDPDVYSFILSIDQSQGDWKKIKCPVKSIE